MGRRSCFAIAITIAIYLAACRPAPTALPTATVAATGTPARPITAVPTVTRVATSTPTPVPPTSTATPVPTSVPTASPTPAATPFVPQAPNDNTFVSGISADGRYVAFVSWADNLIEGDTNERPDVFVYDRYTGTIARVSVASDGTQSDGFSGGASISAHGRWIAFGSEAQSLEPDPVSWEWDTFVHDRRTGQTERIDVVGEGTHGRRSIASSPGSLSADGRYVALAVLVGEGGGPWQVYVHDRQTGGSERISEALDGTPADGWSTAPALSADGRYVAFWSWAGNLAAGDEPACGEAGERLSCGDVFVYDRQAERMERIPVGEGYGLGGGGYELSISDDGQYVVLRGSVYDRRTQTLAPYCGLDAEAQSNVQSSAMSADGRWIAFTDGQVYLCDRESGTIAPVSVAADGTMGDGPSGIVYGHEGYSGGLDLSADGRWLVFTSQAGNLVPGAPKDERCRRPLAVLPGVPHCYDIYLYDRETGTMAKVGVPKGAMGPGTPTATPTQAPTPASALAALATYEPVTDDAGPVVEALSSAVAGWLAAGTPPGEVAVRLNQALPEQREPVTVAAVDLTGDGREDVVVHVPLMGLPLLVLVRREGPETAYEGYALPDDLEAIRLGWAHSLTVPEHGVEQPALRITDLTGDGVPEIIISHGYAGASNFRLRPHAYQWYKGDFRLIFSGELTSWAGYSTLQLEPDPQGGQVIRLTYPVFLPGRNPKGDPNPQGEQFWRWNQDAGRYQLAWQSISPDPIGPSTDDLARAEAALRDGAYEDAIALYDALLSDESWQEAYLAPYTTPGASRRVGERELAAWLDLARVRRGIALALSGRGAEAVEALSQVGDVGTIAPLARAFLDAYAPSADPIAGLAAYERRRAEGPACAPERDLGGGELDCPAAVTDHAYLPGPLPVLAALRVYGADGIAAALAQRDAPVSDLMVHDLDGDGVEEVLWIGTPPWRVSGVRGLPRSDWQQAWAAWQGGDGWRVTGIAAADRITSLQVTPPDAQGRRGIRFERIDPQDEREVVTLFWDGTVKRPLVSTQPAGWPSVGWPGRTATPPLVGDQPEAEAGSVPGSVILYAQGAGLRSLPHQAVLDRPEMGTVYGALAGSEGATGYLSLNALDASPDGRWLAVHDPLPSGPEVRLPGTTWLVDLEEGTLRNLGSPSAAVSWSPDGRALTYARQDTVYVLDLAGNEEPVAIWQQPGVRLFAARWSPQGARIAVAGTDATYSEGSVLEHWVVSPDGKVVDELGAIPLPRYEWSAREVEWAPDGATFSTLGGRLVTLDGTAISYWEHREQPEKLPDPLPLRVAEELALRDVPSESTWARASSHDGQRIAYGNVYVYDRVSETHTRVGAIDDGRVNEVRWSADDETLIVGVAQWQGLDFWGSIYALPPRPGSVPELLVEGAGVYLLDVVPEVVEDSM